MINHIDKVIYTGKTHTTGGRSGKSRSPDDRLVVDLSAPGSQGAAIDAEVDLGLTGEAAFSPRASTSACRAWTATSPSRW